MNQLNTVILEGNVVKQPEVKEPTKDFKVCEVPVAVNRYTKDSNGEGKEEVSFFDVKTFGKFAEYAAAQSTKGRGIRVVGRLKQERWKTKDGKPESRICIIAEHMEFRPKTSDSGVSAKGNDPELEAMRCADEAALEEQVAVNF